MKIRQKRPPVALLVFLIAAFCFTGCGCDDGDSSTSSDPADDDDTAPDDDTADDDTIDDDDDDTYPDVSDLIDSGKSWLKIGAGDKARLDFVAALDLNPTHPEALYGVLAAALARGETGPS